MPSHRVEPRRRFVEKEQLRAPHDAHRHVKTAPLPAGKRLDRLAGARSQPHPLEQLVDRIRARALDRPVRRVVGPELFEQFTHPPPPVVAPRLQHHAHSRAPVLLAVDRIDAQHAHVTAGARTKTFEDLDRGGLAGSVRAQQRHDLAAPDLERHAPEHVDSPVAHEQVLDPDRRFLVHCHDPAPSRADPAPQNRTNGSFRSPACQTSNPVARGFPAVAHVPAEKTARWLARATRTRASPLRHRPDCARASRSLNRWILPLGVLGRSATTCTRRG